MNQLPKEIIETVWHELENLEIETIPGLIEGLGKDQPFILTYLMATGADILNQTEREALLFMGVIIWNAISAVEQEIPEVSGNLLDDKEQKNITMLEYLSGESDSDFVDTVDVIMMKYQQADLLRFIIERLMEEPEIGGQIRDENIGMIVIFLKTVIDCLDEVA